VNRELVAAARETPAATPHLHVPLQRRRRCAARMGRRYSVAQYLARLDPLRTSTLRPTIIVGFHEDDAAFEPHPSHGRARRHHQGHVFPYSPRPGTATGQDDLVPAAVKRERSARLRAASHGACVARGAAASGRSDTVLVDRPGLGYAGDYTRGFSTRRSGSSSAQGRQASRGGILAVAA